MAAFEYANLRARLHAFETRVWPAERLALLLDAHEAGTSYSLMAKALGHGATKGACISQAHRLKLPLRDRQACAVQANSKGANSREAQRRAKAVPPRPPRPHTVTDEAVKAALALPGLAPVLISQLGATQCRWPIGDPAKPDFAFCGRLKGSDGPYCCAHQHAAVDHKATYRARRSKLDRVAQLVTPRRQTERAA